MSLASASLIPSLTKAGTGTPGLGWRRCLRVHLNLPNQSLPLERRASNVDQEACEDAKLGDSGKHHHGVVCDHIEHPEAKRDAAQDSGALGRVAPEQQILNCIGVGGVTSGVHVDQGISGLGCGCNVRRLSLTGRDSLVLGVSATLARSSQVLSVFVTLSMLCEAMHDPVGTGVLRDNK